MRNLVIFVLLSLALAGLAGCRPATRPAATPITELPPRATYPLTLSDDLGLAVTFPAAPQRIITLAPSLTEACFALGLWDRVVGITSFCHYPPECRTKTRIGGYVNASQEKIVSLAPEVVFATRGTPQTFMESLRATGVPVFALDQTSFADVVESLRIIGTICDVAPRAEALAGELQQALAARQQRTAAIPLEQRPAALYVVWLDPLFVAGPGSFQDEMLTACGVRNVAAIDKPFGSLSAEAVIAADPAVVVLSSEHGTDQVNKQLETLRASPAWKNVRAVKEGRVYVLPADYVNVPGPRLIEGLARLEKVLLPPLETRP
jgi:iron complex transport system substrate-binding protein